MYFNLAVSIWGYGCFLAGIAPNPEQSLVGWKIGYIGAIFIGVLFLHLTLTFCEYKNSLLLRLAYIFAVILQYINIFTPLLCNKTRLIFNFYYLQTNFYLLLAHLQYLFFVITSYYLLIKFLRNANGHKKLQALYITFGFLFGFIGGTSTLLPQFQIDIIYPFGNIGITIYCIILAYALLKHNLLEFNIFVKRSLLYSLLITALTALYLTVILIIEKTSQQIIGYQNLVTSIVSAVLIALIFLPLRNKLQLFIDKYILKGTPYELSQENQLLKKEVVDKEKFKVVSTLASSIAHDIKSPLTAIKTYFEYFPQKKNDPKFLEDFQRIVGSEISRINDLTNNLLEFAKPSPLQLQATNINALLEKSLTLLHHQLVQNNINVVKHIDSTDSIQADPNKLTQAFLNLILNAIEAMPDGGTLTISTKSIDEQVIIGIKDTGQGINEMDLKQIFIPFYTTKTKGTGLGLYIIKNIMDEHKAKIKIDSMPDQGTEIKITFNLKG